MAGVEGRPHCDVIVGSPQPATPPSSLCRQKNEFTRTLDATQYAPTNRYFRHRARCCFCYQTSSLWSFFSCCCSCWRWSCRCCSGMVWPTFVVLLSFRYVLDCRQLYLLSSVYAAGFYDWADAKRGRRQWRRLRGVTGTARGTWV